MGWGDKEEDRDAREEARIARAIAAKTKTISLNDTAGTTAAPAAVPAKYQRDIATAVAHKDVVTPVKSTIDAGPSHDFLANATEGATREEARWAKLIGDAPSTASSGTPGAANVYSGPLFGDLGSRSAVHAELFLELNRVRTRPREYIASLQEARTHYNGLVYSIPSRAGARVTTVEGVAAVDDAIAFLSRIAPVPALDAISPLLSGACQSICNDTAARGDTGVPDFAERVAAAGEWHGKLGLALTFGPGCAKEVVWQWLIDDGHSGRDNRLSIFEPDYRVAGIGSGSHPKFHTMVVVTFTVAFSANSNVAADARAPATSSSSAALQWNKEQVQTWLSGLGLSDEFGDKFKRTDGAALLALTEQELRDRFAGDVEAYQIASKDLAKQRGASLSSASASTSAAAVAAAGGGAAAASVQVRKDESGVLQENEAGTHYVITKPVDVSRDKLRLLHCGDSMELTEEQGSTTVRCRIALPSAFAASSVSAALVESPARALRILLLKAPPEPLSAAREGAQLVASFVSQPNPASRDQSIDLDVKQSSSSIVVRTIPSKNHETVAVYLKDQKVLEIESKREEHTDGSTTTKTVIETIKLPFVPAQVESKALLGENSLQLTLHKPTAAAVGNFLSVEIPITLA